MATTRRRCSVRGCKNDGEKEFYIRPRVNVQEALRALVGLKIKAYPSQDGVLRFCSCLVHEAGIPNNPNINRFWLQLERYDPSTDA